MMINLLRQILRLPRSGNGKTALSGYLASGRPLNSLPGLFRGPSQPFPSSNQWNKYLSSSALSICDADYDSKDPGGDLFHFPEVDSLIVGKTGSIRRSFGAQSNAEAMITCGGEALAAHASFDPNYGRAKDWIRSHAVGPAVLSPVLISGLLGALIEAAFPKGVATNSSLAFLRPLIVGVEVRAEIEVVSVSRTGPDEKKTRDSPEVHGDVINAAFRTRKNGYSVDLRTTVVRINDGVCIAEGNHSIWIPDYLRM